MKLHCLGVYNSVKLFDKYAEIEFHKIQCIYTVKEEGKDFV